MIVLFAGAQLIHEMRSSDKKSRQIGVHFCLVIIFKRIKTQGLIKPEQRTLSLKTQSKKMSFPE